MFYGLIKPVPVSGTITQAKNDRTISRLKFPEQMGQHGIVLNFKKFSYGGGEQMNNVLRSSIVLPLPRNIQDTFSVNIQQRELGIIGAGATDAISLLKNSESKMRDVGGYAAGVAGDAISALASSTSEGNPSDFTTAARYLQRAGLTNINSDLGYAIDLSTGTMINPHVSITFDGVSLKSFSFNWTLSPTNEREHKSLSDIIKTIRRSMLPTYATPGGGSGNSGSSFSRGLLEYPMMVDVFFIGLDQEYFFYFKTCMISQFNTDFSPNGISLFKGKTGAKPVFTEMSLSLTEASIHTSEDYL